MKYCIRLLMMLCSFGEICFAEKIKPLVQDPDASHVVIDQFHHEIRSSKGEVYLMCIFDAIIEPHGMEELAAEGKFQIRFFSTITCVLKGQLKVGDRIEFVRYAGDRKETQLVVAGLKGSLIYVFRRVAPTQEPEWFIDKQDPMVTVPYSKQNSEILTRFFQSR